MFAFSPHALVGIETVSSCLPVTLRRFCCANHLPKDILPGLTEILDLQFAA
jgi:hypothetical protein